MGTLLTAGVPVFFVTQSLGESHGQPVPLWRVFWALFGASNQLLAALTLLGVTVWLWRTRRQVWILFVTGIPTVFMYTMSTWALVRMILAALKEIQSTPRPPTIKYILLSISTMLILLAVAMLFEAIGALMTFDNGRSLDKTPKESLTAK